MVLAAQVVLEEQEALVELVPQVEQEAQVVLDQPEVQVEQEALAVLVELEALEVLVELVVQEVNDLSCLTLLVSVEVRQSISY